VRIVSEKVWIREGIVTEGPEGETLAGNQCKSCGQVFFPKAEQVCLNCLEGPLEDLALSRKGALCSYTVVHMPASGFQPPYAVGFVDLPEGVRVFTPLEMEEGKPFKEGMEMELRVGTLWEEEEKEVMGFKFAVAGR
jgi:uncharacterized OB-fold protein